MAPYLDALISKLLALLQRGRRNVQEGALTALAAVADTAEVRRKGGGRGRGGGLWDVCSGEGGFTGRWSWGCAAEARAVPGLTGVRLSCLAGAARQRAAEGGAHWRLHPRGPAPPCYQDTSVSL